MRLISFYLPQYHPIPENDAWWGKGFTEWSNVAKARPLYRGHYQPHIPADLGFYDLRLEETRVAQAELASRYGIGAFCYYHYWFNGAMLLERPFQEVLASGRPDFPFCLCWANENWTRRWDGQEAEVLMEQRNEEYDPAAHMSWLCGAFKDPRYLKVGGRPLFLVYNASDITNLNGTVRSWRETACADGFAEIFLCSVKSFRNVLDDKDAIGAGFDAVVDFHPNFREYPKRRVANFFLNKLPLFLNRAFESCGLRRVIGELPTLRLFSYRDIARHVMARPEKGDRLFPAVMLGWDNTPRRRTGGNVVSGADTDTYKAWLKDAIRRVADNPADEQLVFVNAWNEWGEGCHLEPDQKHGHAFLKASLEVLDEVGAKRNPAAGRQRPDVTSTTP